jgi:hypothetical protein
MKIAFICGSLELGQDGVGDYTRLLASELNRQGHDCRIVALMDRVVQETQEEVQVVGDTAISVLRLPFHQGVKTNGKEALPFISAFNPEWVSLQYVPFSFHNKGLPFGLSHALKPLVNGRKLHLMFHELWVGMYTSANFKLRIWGSIQKKMIQSFISKVQPKQISTQTDLYRWQMQKMGYNASILPLFSNIRPKFSITSVKKIKSKMVFAVFGTIHKDSPFQSFASAISTYAKKHKTHVEIHFMGRCGKYLAEWVSICKFQNINTVVFGEKSDLEISHQLFQAEFGISSTQYMVSEKSGSVAALREHGLPVFCVSDIWKIKGYSVPKKNDIIKFEEKNDINLLFYSNYMSPKQDLLNDVALKFLALLHK